MKTTVSFSFKLILAATIGLCVALFAGCVPSPLGYDCSDSSCEEEPSFQNITVNVTGEGGGHGMVAGSSQTGVNCQISTNANGTVARSQGCSSSFVDAGLGGGFSLTATPAAGYFFGGWSTDCSGSSPVCSLSFPAGPDVTFNVIARFYPLES